ncbi:ParA family protein [bacterium]|nr:MAG: ParA family protein [bacterium]
MFCVGWGMLENLSAWWTTYNVQIVIGIGATVLIALVKPWRDQLGSWIVELFKWLVAFIGSVPNHLALRNHVLGSKPLWNYRKQRTAKLDLAPVTVTVMNFKGGVGKTTLSANLAAALSIRHGFDVLLIDLDYQGSLTELLKPNTNDSSQNNLVGNLLAASKEKKPKSIDDLVVGAVGLPKVKLITAAYELTEVEDNQLLRWLIHEVGTGGDVRNRIAQMLTRRDWNLADKFDVVIMDAPPRLSLASANALRASKYVLVPSKLQQLSSLPVAKMLGYLRTFKSRIRGSFEIAGVVCCMTNGEAATGTETAALRDIEAALLEESTKPRVYKQYIPDLVDVGRPQAVRIGYQLPGVKGDRVRAIFDNIADEFVEQAGLKPAMARAAE